jgi:hypothetical protein
MLFISSRFEQWLGAWKSTDGVQWNNNIPQSLLTATKSNGAVGIIKAGLSDVATTEQLHAKLMRRNDHCWKSCSKKAALEDRT